MLGQGELVEETSSGRNILRAGQASWRPAREPHTVKNISEKQLRYREESDFRALFIAAGFGEPAITTATARLEAPSARWLCERIGFAPGMAAMMAGLGHREPAVIQRLVENLETRLGKGPISLSGMAFIGSAQVL